ncbi:nitroreductase/quinone reductase family protein [Amycolatopsis sp. H20-H5]|uniref:nitroreductase/quinone reductase family protein n=1 Tax=Amycolatopsis sp. H20-H5 TaxID=3046309 RepID=UPI003FA3D9FF
MFEGWELVLLTTVGARTGLRRTSVLGRLEIDGELVVVASAMGAPHDPAWFHNIRKNALVTVETGTETFDAIAAIPPGEERDTLFGKVLEKNPGFGEYQARTTRVIPVVVLHRIEPASGAARVKGMGDWLVEVHDWLRQELKEVRRQVDGAAPLRRPPSDLRAHCLSVCGALKKHHTGEDGGLFPMLAKRFPALAPALTKLGEDHMVVARLQEEIQRLVDDYVPGESDPARLRAELDRLTNELEAHFDYEERVVVTALNAVAPAPAFG